MSCIKHVQRLPQDMEHPHLRDATELDLSGSNLVSLPERFGQLRSLVTLNLKECWELLALPEGIPPRILPSLYCPGHFGASEWGRGISSSVVLNRSLSEGFGQLRSLVTLDLGWCTQLLALPEGIPPRILPLCVPHWPVWNELIGALVPPVC